MVTIVPVSCSCRATSSHIAFMSARVETTLISTLVDASGELAIVEPLVPRLDRAVAGVSLGQDADETEHDSPPTGKHPM